MPRIVIVGAGFAGMTAVQTLAALLTPADSTEVVILEKSAFFYHTIGAARGCIDESYVKNMFIPFDNMIPSKAQGFARLVRAVVTEIATDRITFKAVSANDEVAVEPQTLAFDYLILAMGSTYTVPIKPDPIHFARAYTEQKLNDMRDQVAHAQNILVVGGGGVGCEVAGDIAVHYPDKHVTLLQSRAALASSDKVNGKFRQQVLEGLEALHVNVLLGERLQKRLTGNVFEKRTITTDKGTVIDADIQLLCAGFSPSSELVAAMDASLVEANGLVRVNGKMQLANTDAYAHIFAVGDVSNHPTPKQARYAALQAQHLAYEMVAVIRKKQAEVTKPFPPTESQVFTLPLGPNGGVTHLPIFGGVLLGNFWTRLFLARDLFAGRMWSAMGAKLPEQ